MSYKIGVDGGGTKTECMLVDAVGQMVAGHVGLGCNPSVVGPAAAASILTAALDSLRAQALQHLAGNTQGLPVSDQHLISQTLLCMAGGRDFWQEFAAGLTGFGRVTAVDDSRPILELATAGRPGLVLHAGTGSFVAARAPDGTVHYAGGLGWRFGDPGSGYDLGVRAVARAMLELQGWAPPSRLGPAAREYAQLGATADASAVTSYFYQHADVTRHLAAFTPVVLRLAGEGDTVAREIILASTGALLDLAVGVATKLFSASQLGSISAGLSGPILNHPLVVAALAARSPMPLVPITDAPIEGVRLLLARQ